MKHPLVVIALRVLAVACSLSMLGGYVWFSQRKAQSSVPAQAVPFPTVSEGSAANPESGSETIILGTRSAAQPLSAVGGFADGVIGINPAAVTRPSPWLMSGSKT